jgi:hypothetical protein
VQTKSDVADDEQPVGGVAWELKMVRFKDDDEVAACLLEQTA